MREQTRIDQNTVMHIKKTGEKKRGGGGGWGGGILTSKFDRNIEGKEKTLSELLED